MIALFRSVALVVCFLSLTAHSRAQTWVNYSTASGLWSNAGNWTVLPVSGATTVLNFSSVPQTLPPVSLDFQQLGGYGTINDFAAPFTLNQILLNGGGSAAIGVPGISIASSASSGGIVFAGTAPRITQNGSGSVVFGNAGATLPLQIGSEGLTINGTGQGHVVFQAAISGAGPLVIAQSGATAMFSGAEIQLNGVNTHSGGTTLTSGNLSISNSNSLGAVGALFTVQGGTLRASSPTSIPQFLNLLGPLTLTGTNSLRFDGGGGGNGNINVNFSANATARFTAPLFGNSAYTVKGQGSAFPTLTFDEAGTSLDALSYTATHARILLDNTTTNAQRLNPTAPLTLNSGRFEITGNATANTVVNLNVVSVSGGNTFAFNPSATQTTAFVGTGLSLATGSTFVVEVPSGSTLGGPPGSPSNANLFFNSPLININNVFPPALARATSGGGGAITFVRYDSISGITPLNILTDYTISTANPLALMNNPTANYRVVGTVKNSFEGVNDPVSLNALLFESVSGSIFGGGIYGNGLIHLTSGALATSLTGGASQPSAMGVAVGVALQLDSTGYFHIDANTVVYGSITGSGGLVKAGQGRLDLAGSNTELAGGLFVNSGILAFSDNSHLGPPSQSVTLGNGRSSNSVAMLAFDPRAMLGAVTANSQTLPRGIVLTSGGGGIGTPLQNSSLTVQGLMEGEGVLIKYGAGTLVLSGSNQYIGDTVIQAGTVAVNNDSNLGSPLSNIIFASGSATLQINSSFITNRNLLVQTSETGAGILTNGAGTSLAITGNLGGHAIGDAFRKSGEGTLVLTSQNSLNGPITLGDADPVRRPGTPFAQHGGTISLLGPNGALASATSYTLNPGTGLVLDNSSSINPNRIASASVSLHGGELLLLNEAGQNVFEHTGRDQTAGLNFDANANGSLGGTVSISTSANFTTTLIATSYQPSSTTGLALFRGTNLGFGGPSSTAMIFATPPVLTNGLLPKALYSPSVSGVPADFATLTGNSVTQFNAYLPLPTAGGAFTATHSASGPQVILGTVLSNSVKLVNTSITLLNSGNTLDMSGGAAMVLSTGADSILAGVPDHSQAMLFGSQPASFAVNNTLQIGSPTGRVRVASLTGLYKTGPGTLALSESMIGSLGYVVAQGTLSFTTTQSLTPDSALQIAPGATVTTNSLGTTAAPLGRFSLTGFGTLDIGAGAISFQAPRAFAGSFLGSGAILKTGSNVAILNGNSPLFNGSVHVQAGSLILDADVDPANAAAPGPLGTATSAILLGDPGGLVGATLAITSNITKLNRDITFLPSGVPVTHFLRTAPAGEFSGVANISSTIGLAANTTLELVLGSSTSTTAQGGNVNLTGKITGTGNTSPGGFAVILRGGNFSLAAFNDYVGNTRIDSSTRAVVGLGTNTPFGVATNTLVSDTPSGVTFRADEGPRIIDNPLDYSGANATIGFTGRNRITWSGPMAIGNRTRTFDINSTASVEFSGTITGTGGSIVKNGTGRLVLGGQNTFTGGFVLASGSLAFRSSTIVNGLNQIVSGPIGTGPLTIAGCTISAFDGPQTVQNNIVVTADFTIEGMNDITMGGDINVGTSTRRIIVTNTGASTMSNTISGSGDIIKDGKETIAWSGNSFGSFSGNTLIEDGRLQVTNSTGSGTGTGTVTVMIGGKLEGTGIITGDIGVDSGGEIGGGVSFSPNVGTLTHSGNLSLVAGAKIKVGVSLSGSPAAINTGGSSLGVFPSPTNNSFINKTAGTTTLAAGVVMDVDVTGTVFATPHVNYSYKIATLTGDQSGFSIGLGNINFTGVNVTAASVQGVGSDIYLNFTPVPEPVLLLATGVVLLVFRRGSRQ